MATRKTVKTEATPEVRWFVTGRGKTGKYYAAIPAEVQPAEGVAVALVAQTGAVTYGNLNAPATDLDDKATARIPEGVAVWTFTKDNTKMTPEVRANNAALKAEARAAFLRSEAGIAQAERIAASAQRKAEAAAAGIPDTKTVTVTKMTPEVPAEVPAATEVPSMAELAQAMRDAGFSAAEVMVALSQVNPPATPAAGKATGKATGKPISLASLNAAAGKRTTGK